MAGRPSEPSASGEKRAAFVQSCPAVPVRSCWTHMIASLQDQKYMMSCCGQQGPPGCGTCRPAPIFCCWEAFHVCPWSTYERWQQAPFVMSCLAVLVRSKWIHMIAPLQYLIHMMACYGWHGQHGSGHMQASTDLLLQGGLSCMSLVYMQEVEFCIFHCVLSYKDCRITSHVHGCYPKRKPHCC